MDQAKQVELVKELIANLDGRTTADAGHVVRNKARAAVLSLTRGLAAGSPVGGPSARYFRKLAWASASFAFLADVAMATLGGDLKRKDNLLIGPGERPYIVDFGVASIEKRAAMPWSNAIYRWMHQYDYNAWVKLKNRRQLDNLSAEDAALYRPTATERVARTIRTIWQKLTLRRLRRKYWPRRS